ncbi:MAG TPA: tetratricopeptide repeat protein [Vicinamibacterales bacterium]
MARPGNHPPRRSPCLPAEELAAFLERRLDERDRLRIEVHAAACSECREALAGGATFLAEHGEVPCWPDRGAIARPRSVLLAAGVGLAAVVAVAVGLAVWMARGDSPVSRYRTALFEASAADAHRLVLARLSGGARYLPPPVVTRGGLRPGPSTEVRIAAAELEKQAGGEDSADGRAAFGLARLAAGDLDGAVTALAAALRRQPDSAAIATDLSAAYLTRAGHFDTDDDRLLGLEAADRAIAADPSAPAPYFNRALALEGLRRRDEAIEAWSRYLEIEPSAEWRAEARARLARLRQDTGAGQQDGRD